MLKLPLSSQRATQLVLLITLCILIATQTPFNYTLTSWSVTETLQEFVSHPSNWVDLADNVVMFFPFGFAWAWLSRSWGWSIPMTILLALSLSTGFSLLVETLQLFLPPRMSSIIDIGTNSLGGLLGAGLVQMFLPDSSIKSRLTEEGLD
jgi:glycopeptide antibiotics resistance protein